MDDPTKDTIPRSAVEYICRKNTVSTNPYEHKYHDKFIQFMDDPEISDFGRWQHSNGFNTALVAVKCDLDKVPSVTPSAQLAQDLPKGCTDTISRAAVLNLIEQSCCDLEYDCDNVALRKGVEALPPAQPGWIPCSRELPKNKSYVLTIIYIPGRQAHIRSGWYEDGLFLNDNGDTWKATDKEVVGWMYQPKLPKPYREGGQNGV